jgi:hypothetical protein
MRRVARSLGAWMRAAPRTAARALGLAATLGIATLAAPTDDPTYDDDATIAAYVRDPPPRFDLPAGFQLVRATGLAPVDPLAPTVFVDERTMRIGGRAFDLDESSLHRGCLALTPMPVVHALEWERRLSRALHEHARTPIAKINGGWELVNVVVDAKTPYRKLRAALSWVGCEKLSWALVFADPSGALGVVGQAYPHRPAEPVRVDVERDGFRVSRGHKEGGAHDWTIAYGAGCERDLEGVSVGLQAEEFELERCLAKAMEEQTFIYRYRHSVGITLSAPLDAPFELVGHAIVAADQVAFVGRWVVSGAP